MRDFAAIDFETANEEPSSVCSVGVVIVRDGEIVDSFYSLIHPEPEYYQWFCQRVHGLGPEDTDDAPVFPDVWDNIAPLIEGLPLVATKMIIAWVPPPGLDFSSLTAILAFWPSTPEISTNGVPPISSVIFL